jgi:hypothetical protein
LSGGRCVVLSPRSRIARDDGVDPRASVGVRPLGDESGHVLVPRLRF